MIPTILPRSALITANSMALLTMVLTLVSQWVLQFPLAYVFAEHTSMGARGIWWAFPISNVAIALLTMAVYARGDWKKKRLTEPDDALVRQTSNEIITEEGIRP